MLPCAYIAAEFADGASGTKAFSINTPPSVIVTDPSRTSGQDYATTVQGNAWDMSGPEDIVIVGSENITPVPPLFTAPAGQLTATNTNGSEHHVVARQQQRARHEGHRHEQVSLPDLPDAEIDGPFDLANASVARIIWASTSS